MTSTVITGPSRLVHITKDDFKDEYLALFTNTDSDHISLFFNEETLTKLRDQLNAILIAKDQ